MDVVYSEEDYDVLGLRRQSADSGETNILKVTFTVCMVISLPHFVQKISSFIKLAANHTYITVMKSGMVAV